MKRALVLVLCLAAGCAQAPDRSEGSHEALALTRPAGQWLDNVSDLHSRADRAADPATQRALMNELATTAARPAPSAVAGPDSAGVRQDLYGRAARLALLLGDPAGALALVESGARLDGHATPMAIQLQLLKVEALTAAGDLVGAEVARANARTTLGASR